LIVQKNQSLCTSIIVLCCGSGFGLKLANEMPDEDDVSDAADDKEDKQWLYRLDIIKHELEMEKAKSAALEASNADLKRQMDSGETRSQQIKRVSAMVADLKGQLQEAQ
jgi:hypothetical protein